MTKSEDLCIVRNMVSLYPLSHGGIGLTLTRKDFSYSVAVGQLFQTPLAVVDLAMAFLLRLAVAYRIPLGIAEYYS